MGLDCFIRPAPKSLSRDINLCGGMFSGNGQPEEVVNTETGERQFELSFRGKVYASMVRDWADIDLYTEIDQAGMLKIAEKIEEWIDYQAFKPHSVVHTCEDYGYKTTWQEASDLALMFRECAAVEGSICYAWY